MLPAEFGGLRHTDEASRVAGKAGDLRRQTLRRKIALLDADRSASLRQHAGIGELVLIQGMRQRHQDRGPADGGFQATVEAPSAR